MTSNESYVIIPREKFKSKEEIKTSSQNKKVKRGSAVTTQESLFVITRVCFSLAIVAASLSAIITLIFEDNASTSPLPLTMVALILLLNIILTTNYTKIITNKIVKKKKLKKAEKGESRPMFELAKQLIDKECKIYAVGFASGIKGVIKEVTDGGIRVETKYGDCLLNLDFVTSIECKNK